MIAQELEVSLHMAFVEARQKQHEFITVEHLLLAMLDNPSAAEVLKACGVDLEELRGVPALAIVLPVTRLTAEILPPLSTPTSPAAALTIVDQMPTSLRSVS